MSRRRAMAYARGDLFATAQDTPSKIARMVASSKRTKGEDTFEFQARSMRLPPFVRGFRLLKFEQLPRKDGKDIPRRWEFDFAFPDFKLFVEIDGGVWMAGGGAHSHPVDITRNMTKRNDAALAGWYLLAFTPAEVKSGLAVDRTQRMLLTRGWKRG